MNRRVDCSCLRARHEHGTRGAYERDSCRCLICRAAHARSKQDRRAGRPPEQPRVLLDSIGTRRRLQALSVVGVTDAQIAEHCRLDRRMVGWLRRPHPYVTRELAAVVAGAYDALWDQGRDDTSARKCASMARGRGYLPPLAWDDATIDDPTAGPGDTAGPGFHLDEILVERLVAGRIHLDTPVGRGGSIPERIEAVRQLAARGLSDAEIGERIGTSGEAVMKLRSRQGISPGRPFNQDESQRSMFRRRVAG